MFLISGIREKVIKSYPDKLKKCPQCQKKTLLFKVSQEYCHLFWIPVIPLGRKWVDLVCKNCNRHSYSREREDFFLSNTSTPIYLFSGAILFAVFIILQRPYFLTHQKKKLNFVSKPQINDVYKIEAEELVYGKTKYEYYRVVEIQKDSVYTYKNTLKYGKILDIFDAKDYFIAKRIAFSHKDLKILLEKRIIYDIERNYNENIGYHRTKPE
ncbi:zinc ribbon domain-containing protein [Aureispira anguillae]|uniref:Zinc-ribbon 15 domain-containing protein n=1 Tax=Aureispira anguillae TaxID=2864201 RepID=A0A915YE57_9BACT|nr:hypothetical protein [Aureispira anguillae]BDS11443.1 hypothetical protein AsAng_0021570 [Aureispira anguillae]